MKINGTKIKDLGFHLNPLYEVSAPEAKTRYVDIPFGDGALDLTEALLGYVQYNQRKVKFTLEKLRPKADWLEYYYDFLEAYNGQRVQLQLPHDPYYYFEGRLSVGEMQRGDYMSFECELLADPYRYANEETIVNVVSTTTEQSVVFDNDRMKVVPEITTDGNVQIFHKTNSWSISEGTWTLPIVFEKGDNQINFKGNATVQVRYRKGRL